MAIGERANRWSDERAPPWVCQPRPPHSIDFQDPARPSGIAVQDNVSALFNCLRSKPKPISGLWPSGTSAKQIHQLRRWPMTPVQKIRRLTLKFFRQNF